MFKNLFKKKTEEIILLSDIEKEIINTYEQIPLDKWEIDPQSISTFFFTKDKNKFFISPWIDNSYKVEITYHPHYIDNKLISFFVSPKTELYDKIDKIFNALSIYQKNKKDEEVIKVIKSFRDKK